MRRKEVMKKWKQFLVGSVAAALWLAPSAHAQNVQRFAANYLMFDGSEVDATTSNTTGNPILFYDKTVKVPASSNVLYVSVYGTTDTHSGGAELINCQVDGTDCNNTGKSSSNGSPAGWVKLANASADLHDNAASYSWCAVLPKKTGKNSQNREVTLRLASDGVGEVFMEQIHIFVDGSKVKDATNACTDGDITPGS
jgi:hypothetical protein